MTRPKRALSADKVVGQELGDRGVGPAGQVLLHHPRHVAEELRAVRARRDAAPAHRQLADALHRRVDVVELVDDRVELGHPGRGAGIDVFLLRARQRLVAEARQAERDQVVDA